MTHPSDGRDGAGPNPPGTFPPDDGCGSVTGLIGPLKTGDAAAADGLWERYFLRLVALARSRLGPHAGPVADEEDVALSAFRSFYKGVELGRFPDLNDRTNLWRLLVTITARKASDLVARQGRRKHGGGVVRAEGYDMGGVEGRDAPPDLLAEAADECRRLLEKLDAPDLKRTATLKLEGFSNEEIAARLGCVVRSVERKLAVIRRVWEAES
jgi:DNA-directed RNA polymerase specialized sigma24 family protein